jgi:hypothetical protein
MGRNPGSIPPLSEGVKNIAFQGQRVKSDLLLCQLLRRGDKVSIERGRLNVIPASGALVPSEWLQDNAKPLSCELISATGIDAYLYHSSSTGRYGKQKAGGVTLQFYHAVTGAAAYAIFNASLNRCRGPLKGKPLRKGQFRVGKRSHFYRFWLSTGLELPRRLSALYDYMGNLEGILFTSNMQAERMDTGSIRPLSIDHNVIKRAFHPDKVRAETGQLSDNSRTNFPDSNSAHTLTQQRIQENQTTDLSNHGNKVTRETGIRSSLYSSSKSKPLQEQTHEEWLFEYENAKGV